MLVMWASIVKLSDSMKPSFRAKDEKGIVEEHTSIEAGLEQSEKEREE